MEWLGGAANWFERFNPAYVSTDADFAAKPAADPLIVNFRFAR